MRLLENVRKMYFSSGVKNKEILHLLPHYHQCWDFEKKLQETVCSKERTTLFWWTATLKAGVTQVRNSQSTKHLSLRFHRRRRTSWFLCLFFCPQAIQQPFPHVCPLASGRTRREEDGWRQSELRTQTQSRRESDRLSEAGRGSESTGEEDTTAAVHDGGFTRQMRREQISQWERREEGVQSPKRDGNTETEWGGEGLAIQKPTSWSSRLIYTSATLPTCTHAHANQHTFIRNPCGGTMATADGENSDQPDTWGEQSEVRGFLTNGGVCVVVASWRVREGGPLSWSHLVQ